MANRFAGKKGTVYHRLKQAGCGPFDPAIHLDVLDKLKQRLTNIKKPRRVFIASMGDVGCKTFFHVTTKHGVVKSSFTTGEVLQSIHKLCTEHSRHTFLLLSKNPRMFQNFDWPCNAHVGTSIDTSNAVAKQRLTDLSSVYATVKWVSVEPLIDPMFVAGWLEVFGLSKVEPFRPDWVVVGGLSGKKQLPKGCDMAAEKIVRWCRQRKIPVFLKDNLPRLSIESPHEYP
jgi:protein gp37